MRSLKSYENLLAFSNQDQVCYSYTIDSSIYILILGVALVLCFEYRTGFLMYTIMHVSVTDDISLPHRLMSEEAGPCVPYLEVQINGWY